MTTNERVQWARVQEIMGDGPTPEAAWNRIQELVLGEKSTDAPRTDDARATPVESDSERRVRERIEEISEWWRVYSDEAIERTAPKSVEYAGSDLDIMATGMLALLGDRVDGMPDVQAMMMGRYMAVQFYALGKVARSLGRLSHGEMPGPDNEFDLMVYAVMARRIRETGMWT